MRGQIIVRVIAKGETHLPTMVRSKAPEGMTIQTIVMEALAEGLVPGTDASMRGVCARNDGSLKVLDVGFPNQKQAAIAQQDGVRIDHNVTHATGEGFNTVLSAHGTAGPPVEIAISLINCQSLGIESVGRVGSGQSWSWCSSCVDSWGGIGSSNSSILEASN